MVGTENKTVLEHDGESESGQPPLEVKFDAAEFMQYLDSTDWPDDQKIEYLKLVWTIVCEFVALGFGVHPIQQAQELCEQLSENASQPTIAASPVVNSSHHDLVKEFVRLNRVDVPPGAGGVADG